MRIGLTCPYSLTVPGGVQAQVLGLARSMRELGHEVRVLAPADGPPPDPGVTPLGASIPFTANGSVAPLAPDPSCLLRTIRAIRDEDFDVLGLHEPLAPGPNWAALAMADVPVVGTFHLSGVSGAYRWLRPICRWMADRLDHRCAVSAAAAAMAEEYLGGEYELLFNGIEVERFAKATPWPTEGPTILFVGRHEERKGLAVLLEAMAELPSSVRLWVGGSGPQTAELQARSAGDPRIEWLGRLTEEEKARRLRGADAFCLPSLHGESFGVVLLEGMAAGTPVVASDLEGYRTVATRDRDALLVPPGDARGLAEGLRRVLTEPDLADRLVAGGEARAAEYSMDRLAEHYLATFTRLTS